MDKSQFFTRNSLTSMLLVMVVTVVGVLFAAGGFVYSGSPSFCGSCHSMKYVYTTYKESNHKQFTCIDCHVPHDSVVDMMFVKGENGMRHTYHEFLRDYPDTINFTPKAKVIANKNCLRCHISTVENTHMAAGGEDCISCHKGIAHRRNLNPGGIKVE